MERERSVYEDKEGGKEERSEEEDKEGECGMWRGQRRRIGK